MSLIPTICYLYMSVESAVWLCSKNGLATLNAAPKATQNAAHIRCAQPRVAVWLFYEILNDTNHIMQRGLSKHSHLREYMRERGFELSPSECKPNENLFECIIAPQCWHVCDRCANACDALQISERIHFVICLMHFVYILTNGLHRTILHLCYTWSVFCLQLKLICSHEN